MICNLFNYTVFLFTATLFLLGTASAQDSENFDGHNTPLNKLYDYLQNHENDTTRICILNSIAWQLIPNNPDEGILYADSALNIALSINWKKGEAEALNNTGEALRYKGKIRQSLEYHNKALKIFEDIKDKNEITNTLSHIGAAYYNISDFPKALKYFDRALILSRELKDKHGIAKNLNHIGILYGTIKEYRKSLDYFNESLMIYEELKEKLKAAIQLGNIGINYTDMKEYNLALVYYEKALTIFKESGDTYNYSVYLANIGIAYSNLHNYSKALNYFEESLKYAQEIEEDNGIAYQYGNIGNLYLEMAMDSTRFSDRQTRVEYLLNAINYLTKAVDKFESLGVKIEQKKFLFSLSNAYQEIGSYKDALETYRTAREIQDTIFSAENKKMISELGIKQELDLKEKEIEILSNEKEYQEIASNYLIGILSLLGILFIALLVFYFKSSNDNRTLQENIRIRQKAENALMINEIELKKHRDHLEKLVQERTADLKAEISERLRAEEELLLAKEKAEALNKAKTIFLANMSHELRTPLVGILGYSDLLSKELKNSEQKEMAEGINRTGVRLLNTLSMVLDLTRVESDKYEIRIRPIYIAHILKETYNNFNGAASRKNIKFNLAIHDESVMLNIDSEMLKVILDNLTNNAIKFTNKGEINISTGIETGEDKSYVYIKISDTGIGMSEEDICLIFEEFRQLSEGTTKDYPGTGLGLSITKRYVELLNGEISVESKLGVGSAFTVKFRI